VGIYLKKIYIALIIIFTSVFVFSGVVTGVKDQNNTISLAKSEAGSNYQSGPPAIDGTRIVWQQDTLGHPAIYVKNLASGQSARVLKTEKSQKSPDISGVRVVWIQEDFPNQWVIYVKNLKTGKITRVRKSNQNQQNPSINGDRIVWQQRSFGIETIYVKNLATGKIAKVQTSTRNQLNPSISDNRIVWSQETSSGNYAIHIKNLVTGKITRVQKSAENQIKPDISGTGIVWQQESSGKYVIYVKSIATGTLRKVFASNQTQLNPIISGKRIVWEQYDSGKYGVYLKNLSTGTATIVEKSSYNQLRPVISGVRMVWMQEDSSGNYTISIKDISMINPPRVIFSDPSNNTGNIPTTKLFVIKFNRLINDPNPSLIQLKRFGGSEVPLILTVRNNELYIDHSVLSTNTTYTLILKPGSVKDRTGYELSSTHKATFTTASFYMGLRAVLIIPRIGLHATIKTTSPNGYNVVYHYPNSVYPGTPGESAVLGHRTTWSAPFRYIPTLWYGDKVIVRDYKVNKQCTFRVVSNGNDIRWYFNPTPYTFKKTGDSYLLLFTCHPPGLSAAKWVVHCKLESTVPL
jgi:beta propeller repeat protein